MNNINEWKSITQIPLIHKSPELRNVPALKYHTPRKDIYMNRFFFRSNGKTFERKKTFQNSYIFNDFLWILLRN